MKLIVGIGFAILSVLAIKVAQYEAGYANYYPTKRYNNTGYNNNRGYNTGGYNNGGYNNGGYNNGGYRYNSTGINKGYNNGGYNSGGYNNGGYNNGGYAQYDIERFKRFNNNGFRGRQFNNATTFGQVRPNDKLIYKEVVNESSKLLRKVKKTVTIPNILRLSYKLVSAVNVTNLNHSRKKVIVSLLQGGIGQNNVTIQLKSERNEPIRYIVEFFGI